MASWVLNSCFPDDRLPRRLFRTFQHQHYHAMELDADSFNLLLKLGEYGDGAYE